MVVVLIGSLRTNGCCGLFTIRLSSSALYVGSFWAYVSVTTYHVRKGLGDVRKGHEGSRFVRHRYRRYGERLFSSNGRRVRLSFQQFLVSVPYRDSRFVHVFPRYKRGSGRIVSFSMLFCATINGVGSAFFVYGQYATGFLSGRRYFASSVVDLRRERSSRVFPFLFYLRWSLCGCLSRMLCRYPPCRTRCVVRRVYRFVGLWLRSLRMPSLQSRPISLRVLPISFRR